MKPRTLRTQCGTAGVTTMTTGPSFELRQKYMEYLTRNKDLNFICRLGVANSARLILHTDQARNREGPWPCVLWVKWGILSDSTKFSGESYINLPYFPQRAYYAA